MTIFLILFYITSGYILDQKQFSSIPCVELFWFHIILWNFMATKLHFTLPIFSICSFCGSGSRCI